MRWQTAQFARNKNFPMVDSYCKIRPLPTDRGQAHLRWTFFPISEMIENDRCLTIWKIAAHMRLLYGDAQSIISNDLGFRKLSVKWVILNRSECFLEAHCHLWWGVGVLLHPEVEVGKHEVAEAWITSSMKSQHPSFCCGSFSDFQGLQHFFFSMNPVELMLRTTSNCLMKWN